MGIRNRRLSFAFKSSKSKEIRFSGTVFVLAFLSAISSVNASQLTELVTVGKTKPAEEYYTNLSFRDSKVDAEKASKLLKEARNSISREMFFPLVPSNMQPGVMKGFKFKETKRVQPFAVVGTDPLSIKWLRFRFDKLAELNAPIYVVEAESFQQLQAFSSEFSGLKFVPSSGDGIGKELKVGAYPFLVTSTGVWQ